MTAPCITGITPDQLHHQYRQQFAMSSSRSREISHAVGPILVNVHRAQLNYQNLAHIRLTSEVRHYSVREFL